MDYQAVFEQLSMKSTNPNAGMGFTEDDEEDEEDMSMSRSSRTCLLYTSIVLLLLVAVSASAQKAERDYIRKGNRFFKDSVYVDVYKRQVCEDTRFGDFQADRCRES